MGLVDYGSDDESDMELLASDAPKQKQSLFAALPAPKHKDTSAPKRIKINAPQSQSIVTEERARDPKAEEGSGLSALLPPPKRSQQKISVTADQGNGASVMTKRDDHEVELKGSNVLFKPNSIARPSSKSKSGVAATTTQQQQSLFSISTELGDRKVESGSSGGSEYQPLLATESRPKSVTRLDMPVAPAVHPSEAYLYDSESTYTPTSLDEPSESTIVSEKKKKRTRGEEGPVMMQEYNVEAQYAQNLAYIESGAGVEAAPVRFVGGGKHQLSSLLNLAQSQKDTMESSFANQKKAMREGKAKYGR